MEFSGPDNIAYLKHIRKLHEHINIYFRLSGSIKEKFKFGEDRFKII